MSRPDRQTLTLEIKALLDYHVAGIGEPASAPDEANAEFIVRACNSHEALVKSLTSLLACKANTDGHGVCMGCRDIANAALALARGEVVPRG